MTTGMTTKATHTPQPYEIGESWVGPKENRYKQLEIRTPHKRPDGIGQISSLVATMSREYSGGPTAQLFAAAPLVPSLLASIERLARKEDTVATACILQEIANFRALVDGKAS